MEYGYTLVREREDDEIENGNVSKKPRIEKTSPSRVVHIHFIPDDISEREIINLGIPFGRVSNVFVLRGKNQAFLELVEESAATAMVSYFTNIHARLKLRGRSVCVQFSRHIGLTTSPNWAAKMALEAAEELVRKGETLGGSNRVLRMIIDKMFYPVTVEVLFEIFSRVGQVLRIVTFTKNGHFHVLIEYPNAFLAQNAKLEPRLHEPLLAIWPWRADQVPEVARHAAVPGIFAIPVSPAWICATANALVGSNAVADSLRRTKNSLSPGCVLHFSNLND